MRPTLLLGLCVLSFGLSAQNASIKKVELAGDKVIVHFDLDDSNSSNEYLLNLYASKDNFSAPLTKVKGDIGTEVKPGVGKKIEWNILEEYGGYKGRISLELRGKVYVAFVKLKNFDPHKSYKRGKQYDILWKAGNSNPINIELYKGNQRIQGEMNHPNNGSYTLSVPANAKLGSDYRLKISDSKINDDIVYTPFFKVASKVPLLVKVLPVLAVGGAIAALGGKKGGGGAVVVRIPDPPLPIGN
jgi:hypothetical protein